MIRRPLAEAGVLGESRLGPPPVVPPLAPGLPIAFGAPGLPAVLVVATVLLVAPLTPEAASNGALLVALASKGAAPDGEPGAPVTAPKDGEPGVVLALVLAPLVVGRT